MVVHQFWNRAWRFALFFSIPATFFWGIGYLVNNSVPKTQLDRGFETLLPFSLSRWYDIPALMLFGVIAATIPMLLDYSDEISYQKRIGQIKSEFIRVLSVGAFLWCLTGIIIGISYGLTFGLIGGLAIATFVALGSFIVVYGTGYCIIAIVFAIAIPLDLLQGFIRKIK